VGETYSIIKCRPCFCQSEEKLIKVELILICEGMKGSNDFGCKNDENEEIFPLRNRAIYFLVTFYPLTHFPLLEDQIAVI
jgi:hypothetical protein